MPCVGSEGRLTGESLLLSGLCERANEHRVCPGIRIYS